jgi:glycosyltransferase involved in cell wall biosynthesis
MRADYHGKIAVFLPSLGGGGVQRIVVNLLRGFSKRGMNVDLVLAKAEGPYLTEVPSSVKIVDLGANRVLTSLPALVQYLRKERPATMLTAMEHVNIVAIWAALLSRVKVRVIISIHVAVSAVLDASTPRGWFWITLMKMFYPLANLTVVVSQAAKEDYINTTKLEADDVKVIYNPVITPGLFEKAKIPLHHPWFEAGQPPVILGAGRLTKQKDFSTLIRAFAQVHRQKNARLIIIGEGEERVKLEKLVADLGIEEHVQLPGFVDNPFAYMARASVFVLSSAYEGLPTVLIEALAVGTSVVSTDCPSGPREILNNGQYGELVPVGDEAAMAQGIVGCITESKPSSKTPLAWSPYELDTVTDSYLSALFGEYVA